MRFVAQVTDWDAHKCTGVLWDVDMGVSSCFHRRTTRRGMSRRKGSEAKEDTPSSPYTGLILPAVFFFFFFFELMLIVHRSRLQDRCSATRPTKIKVGKYTYKRTNAVGVRGRSENKGTTAWLGRPSGT